MQNSPSARYLHIAIVFAVIGLLAMTFYYGARAHTHVSTPTQPAAVASATTATSTAATSSVVIKTATTTGMVKKPSFQAIKSPPVATSTGENAVRIQKPYATDALSSTVVNDRARAALVNILCTTSTGLVRPISGSGVLIDPRGVILTNAHVAQYVLLSESANIDFQCFIRTGSPATPRWLARVMYIPPVWVSAHASEITSSHPLGTGEHDYALLYIVASLDGSPLPARFPYLPTDTREGIGFVNDPVVVASYPAEFLGGLAAANDLYSAGSATTIKKLLTFSTTSVDVLSLGGVIEAQSGSSGGAVANAWGYLVGLLVTTSEGATTEERDLRAVTLNYIDRDIATQTGKDLDATLAGDPRSEMDDFTRNLGPGLIDLLLKSIGLE